MAQLRSDYKSWKKVLYKKVRFLLLSKENGDVHVYNEAFDWYGVFQSERSFRTMYAQKGEALNLTKTQKVEIGDTAGSIWTTNRESMEKAGVI